MNAMVNMKFGKRLAVGFGAVTTLIVVLGVVASWEASSTVEVADRALEGQTRGYVISRLDKNITAIGRELAVLVLSKDKAVRELATEGLESFRAHYAKRVEQLKAMKGGSTEEAAKLSELLETIASAREVNVRVQKLLQAGQDGEAQALYNSTSLKNFEAIDRMTATLSDMSEKSAQQDSDATHSQLSTMRKTIVGIGILTLVLAVYFGVSITRSIAQPMAALSKAIGEVAKGNLTVEIDSSLVNRKDEAGIVGG